MKTVKILVMALALIAIIVGGTTTFAQSGSLSASFMADVNTGAAPLTVHFQDTSDGAPTAWHWDFGDGSSSTLQNPVYTYNTPGTYTVNLTVTSGAQSDTMSGAIIVTNSMVTTPTPNNPIVVQPILVPVYPHHGQPHHGYHPPANDPNRNHSPDHGHPTPSLPPTPTPPSDHHGHR